MLAKVLCVIAMAAMLAAACTTAQTATAEVVLTNPPPLASATLAAPKAKTPLRVFCAGSLIVPFDELEKTFEASHPQVDVLMECHGSIQVIRHVTELHELIDVVATADHALIPMMMYPTTDAETGKPYASWYIRFATNRLGLAYTSRSLHADKVNAQNWYTILAEPGVRFGLADPRFDAAGYRALMALRLAEDAYGQPGLLRSMIDGRFKIPITVFEEDNFTEISVPEVLEPKPDSGIVLRGASIQLIALLESGDLDYAFEYESVIRQHSLELVALPQAVNLGVDAYNETYGRVQVKMDFQRFASLKPVFKGEQIGYGITIPSNAPQPELAAEFIAFLLGEQGRKVMEANFNPVFDDLICNQPANVPVTLQTYCGGGGQP